MQQDFVVIPTKLNQLNSAKGKAVDEEVDEESLLTENRTQLLGVKHGHNNVGKYNKNTGQQNRTQRQNHARNKHIILNKCELNNNLSNTRVLTQRSKTPSKNKPSNTRAFTHRLKNKGSTEPDQTVGKTWAGMGTGTRQLKRTTRI